MHPSSADATVLSPLSYYLLATTMCGSCARAFLERFRCVRSIAADGLAAARRQNGRRPACRAGSLPTARKADWRAEIGEPRVLELQQPQARKAHQRGDVRDRRRRQDQLLERHQAGQRRDVAHARALRSTVSESRRSGERSLRGHSRSGGRSRRAVAAPAPRQPASSLQSRIASPRGPSASASSAPAATVCAASRTEPFVLAALTIGWSTSAPVHDRPPGRTELRFDARRVRDDVRNARHELPATRADLDEPRSAEAASGHYPTD